MTKPSKVLVIGSGPIIDQAAGSVYAQRFLEMVRVNTGCDSSESDHDETCLL